MSHLQAQWRQVQAWRVPTEIRGYPLPLGGQFAPTQASLDPEIFDAREQMHPWIRWSLIAILDSFWRPRYGDWQDWTRIYLAGSLASYWWGTLDFDTLVGVDTHRFVRDHPEFGGMSDPEVCQALTHEFIYELDPLMRPFSFPPSDDVWSVLSHLSDGGVHPAVEARLRSSSINRADTNNAYSAGFVTNEECWIGDSVNATGSQSSNTSDSSSFKMGSARPVSSQEPESEKALASTSFLRWTTATAPGISAVSSATTATGSLGDTEKIWQSLRDSWPTSGVTPLGPIDEVTWYVNPAAYDIRAIKPYAAYDVTNDRWAVHPDKMAKSWGAHALGHAFWERMADVADGIKAALKLPEPARTSSCLAIYDRIHTDRGQAFGPAGRGVTDPRSLQWIVLNRWGLLGPLEVAAHPGREMAHIPPAIAARQDGDRRIDHVRNMIDNYAFTDGDNWDEVKANYDFDHPKMQAMQRDIRNQGVKEPIPVDYEQQPPKILDGHTRLALAERAGNKTVPTMHYDEFHYHLDHPYGE